MTYQMIRYWPNERLEMDTDRLADVYVKLGEMRAHLAVSRAVEDLICVLDLLNAQAEAGRREAVARTADRLEQIARPLGLSSVADVARDLRLLSNTNPVAEAAVLARLHRVSERSVDLLTKLQAEIS